MRISVNGTWHTVAPGRVTYDQIAALAGRPQAVGLTIAYDWRKPDSDVTRAGTVRPGKPVVGETGMHFTAVYTGNA